MSESTAVPEPEEKKPVYGRVHRCDDGVPREEPLEGSVEHEECTRDVLLARYGPGEYEVRFDDGTKAGPVEVKRPAPPLPATVPVEQEMQPAPVAGAEPGIWSHTCLPKGRLVRVATGGICPNCGMNEAGDLPPATGPTQGLWSHICPETEQVLAAHVPKGEACPNCGMDEAGYRPRVLVHEKPVEIPAAASPYLWQHSCMGTLEKCPWDEVCPRCGQLAPKKPEPPAPPDEQAVEEALEEAVDDGRLKKAVNEDGDTVYKNAADYDRLARLLSMSVLPRVMHEDEVLFVASMTPMPEEIDDDFFPQEIVLQHTLEDGSTFTAAYLSAVMVEEDLEEGAHLDVSTAVAVAKALLSIAVTVPKEVLEVKPKQGYTVVLTGEQLSAIVELREKLRVEEWLEKPENDPTGGGAGTEAEGGESSPPGMGGSTPGQPSAASE